MNLHVQLVLPHSHHIFLYIDSMTAVFAVAVVAKPGLVFSLAGRLTAFAPIDVCLFDIGWWEGVGKGVAEKWGCVLVKERDKLPESRSWREVKPRLNTDEPHAIFRSEERQCRPRGTCTRAAEIFFSLKKKKKKKKEGSEGNCPALFSPLTIHQRACPRVIVSWRDDVRPISDPPWVLFRSCQ
jgi:hypothetical protein